MSTSEAEHVIQKLRPLAPDQVRLHLITNLNVCKAEGYLPTFALLGLSISSTCLHQVGTREWADQHDAIEKLNLQVGHFQVLPDWMQIVALNLSSFAMLLQAHHNAQSHSDEFVMEALVSYDKLGIIIHDLLAYEVIEKLLPSHRKVHHAWFSP